MTLDDLEALAASSTPQRLFGDDPDAAMRRFHEIAHPDRNPDERQRAAILYDKLVRMRGEVLPAPGE